MDRIVDDFMKSASGTGCGFFMGKGKAVRIARGMTKMQKKKYSRYGIVPSAFLVCLREMGMIRADTPIPCGGASIKIMSEIINKYRFSNEQLRHLEDFLKRLRIIKKCKPEISNSHFACQNTIWQNLELMKVNAKRNH